MSLASRYRALNEKRPTVGKVTLIGTLATVLALFVALIQLIVDITDDDTPFLLPVIGTASPATRDGATPVPDGDSSGYEDRQSDSPPSELPTRCREWTEVAHAPVLLRPCVAAREEGVILSVQVRAKESHGVPAVTVWVWAMHIDKEALEKKRYDRTREPATLRHCRLSLADDNDIKTCGHFTVVPTTGPGSHAAATSASTEHDDYPRGWSSTTYAGTQSPAVAFRTT